MWLYCLLAGREQWSMAGNRSPRNAHTLTQWITGMRSQSSQHRQCPSHHPEATAGLPGTGSINYRLMMPFACTFLKTVANVDLIIEDEWYEAAFKCSIESLISFFKEDLYHLSAHQYTLTLGNRATWNLRLVLYGYSRFINLLLEHFPSLCPLVITNSRFWWWKGE